MGEAYERLREAVFEETRRQVRERDAEREQQIRQAIDEHLQSTGSLGWGQFFTITNDVRRAECVEYIYRLFQGVDARLQEIEAR